MVEPSVVGFYDEGNETVRRRFFSSLSVQNGYCCNHLVRRAFVEDNQLWFKEGVRYEDTLWKHRAICKANSYCMVPQYTYRYRRHAESYTLSNVWEKTGRQYFAIVNTIADEIDAPLANMQASYYLEQILALYRNHAKDAYLPAARALCRVLRSNKHWWQSKAIAFYFNHNVALHLRRFEPRLLHVIHNISRRD